MIKGRVFFEGKVQSRWSIPNQNSFKTVIFLGEHKGSEALDASFCDSWRSGKSSRHLKSLSSSENQLKSLDSYFRKLHDYNTQPPLSSWNRGTELTFGESDQFEAKKGLTSIEDYLGKLNRDASSEKYISPHSGVETIPSSSSSYIKKGYWNKNGEPRKLRSHMQLKDQSSSGVPEKISDDEPANLYLIGILASINIAVFLFEIASPIKNSELHLFSLPRVYGAKINQLILDGEWWRLVTPMFLHSGVFHIVLSSWMLVTFGPQVCRAYGAFAFFLIYLLGGLAGNLISFLHMPDPTVGGTGPVFAVIGALISYQIQNRALIRNNASQDMLQKAIIATCLSCTLSNFGPVDNWTHMGAAFTGFAYGFFRCPTVNMDERTSESGKEEGIRLLVTGYADSCKSILYFCILVLMWYSLLFVIEPPL